MTYEIDLIIRRTLLYSGLSLSLGATYYGSVVLLQEMFRSLAKEESTLAIIVSTLVIAALFSPLKQRLQTIIDRRFYRRKYDTAKSIEALAATFKNEVGLESLSERLVQVVDDTIQPEHISLWLR